MKRKKAQLIIGLIAMLILGGLTNNVYLQAKSAPKEPLSVIDDETVYVLLEPTGKVKQTVVVDWLRAEGSGSLRIEDIAPDEKIEVLKDTPLPKIENGKLIFLIDANSFKDLYYQVKTKKELPLQIEVSYELNGKKVSPEEIVGKSGKIKLTIKFKNILKQNVVINYPDAEGTLKSVTREIYAPLFVVTSVNLDAEKFNDVKVQSGWLSAQGSKFSLNWFAFPQGEAEIGFEAEGKDIEIPSIIISAIPRLPQEVNVDMAEQFKELYEGLKGLSELNEAHQTILSKTASQINLADFASLGEIQQGMTAISSGLSQSASGVQGLATLVNGQLIYLDQLINSLDSGAIDVQQLIDGLTQLKVGVDSAAARISQAAQAFGAYDSFARQSLDLNTLSLQLASKIQTSTTETTTVTNLIDSLNQQKALLQLLVNGGSIEPNISVPSLINMKNNLEAAVYGLQQISTQLDMIVAQIATLKDLPENLESLKSSLKVLKDGGTINNTYMPGLVFVRDSLNPVAQGILEIKQGLDSSSKHFDMLTELPDALLSLRKSLETVVFGGTLRGKDLPGLKDAGFYLGTMKEGIATGYDRMEEAKAYQERLKEEAEKYDSFLGRITKQNYSGRLRFIFKIEGITKN
jgi:putative membrane protein